jgi:DNA mismatch repair protein MutL
MVNKIAAGEVIERPASVVKELLENALDSAARRVVIECRDGGRELVSVADDGCGMSAADLALSVLPHATSKVENPSDLTDVRTLGFRGEALASIAAVSRLSIETRREVDQEGARLVVEGGVQRETGSIGRAPGTTVIVRGLFFNTPARRRFLKPADAEARQVTQAVAQLAAAYPQVGFRLVQDGRLVLDLVSADRTSRAAELLGVATADLAVARLETHGFEVEVATMAPGIDLRGRNRQFIVVHCRPVQAHRLIQAAATGYGSLLPEGTRPGMVLWVSPGPGQVDVNVHPAKREVRFTDELAVCRAVEQAVRQALATPEAPALRYPSGAEPRSAGQVAEWPTVDMTARAGTADDQTDHSRGASTWTDYRAVESTQQNELGWPAESGTPPDQAWTPQSAWQVHDRYLLFQVPEGILLVDGDAARERVLYEEVLSQLQGKVGAAQQLLFPQTVHLSPAEQEALVELIPLLTHLGFGLREFGGHTSLLESLPAGIPERLAGDALRLVLDEYLAADLPTGTDNRERLARAYARQIAVGSHGPVRSEDAVALVGRLRRSTEPRFTPDGRPTMRILSFQELDRLLHRA